MTIRPARLSDLPAITKIYNEAIRNTTATFDTKPKTGEEQLAWFNTHDDRHPIFVAERDGSVVGWACLSQWSDRCAYSGTAEISLYIRDGFREKGIGRKLMESIDAEAQRRGFHTAVVRITEGNLASVHLAERFGFRPVGVMEEVGYKFGRWLDVHVMQKMYSEAKTPQDINAEGPAESPGAEAEPSKGAS